MSYDENGTWVDLTIALTAISIYLVVILRRAGDGGLVTVDYVGPLLWTIGGSAVATAVGRAAAALMNPDRDLADVRDRAFSRRGEFFGQWPLAVAAFTAMAMAMAQWDPFWIANTLAVGIYTSTIVSGVVSLLAYRRGSQ